MKEQKLNLIQKNNVWLLCDNEKIIWVVGMRIDERAKIDSKTTEVLKVCLFS